MRRIAILLVTACAACGGATAISEMGNDNDGAMVDGGTTDTDSAAFGPDGATLGPDAGAAIEADSAALGPDAGAIGPDGGAATDAGALDAADAADRIDPCATIVIPPGMHCDYYDPSVCHQLACDCPPIRI